MQLPNIHFFTPITFGNQPKTDRQVLLETVDDYFFLGGKKAALIQLDELHCETLLIDSTETFLTTCLKVISYITLLIPILMLLIKAFLRSTFSLSANQRISPEREWVFLGTQQGCSGTVDIAEVENIRKNLEHQDPTGIRFNRNKIAPTIKGGACTAMSLEFADYFFKILKMFQETPDSDPKKLVNALAQIEEQFKLCPPRLKATQAAYNTIEVVKGSVDTDYSLNKIQALTGDHGFKVVHSSKELDISELKDPDELKLEVDALPLGVHLLRIIKPADNEKLEENGHSLIYIKGANYGFHYDPNYGLKNLRVGKPSKVLYDSFKSCFRTFGVSKARFYQLN